MQEYHPIRKKRFLGCQSQVQDISFLSVKSTQADNRTTAESDESIVWRCVEPPFYLADVQTDGYVRAVYQVDVTVVPVRLYPNDMSETDSPVNGLA